MWPIYSDDAIRSVADLLSSGRSYFSNDDNYIQSVEDFFHKRLNKHCLMVNSGTSALYSAFYAVGLTNKHSVLVPTNTFRATITPILHFTSDVRFYGFNESFSIKLDNIIDLIDDSTRIIVISHMWGVPQDFYDLIKFCKRNGILILEDCSQAHASFLRDEPVGHFSDISIFSLGTKKIISGGVGGIVAIKDQDVFERAILISQPPLRAKKMLDIKILEGENFLGKGVNFRASPISAVLCMDHIQNLDRIIKDRIKRTNAIKSLLDNLFGKHIEWPGEIAKSDPFKRKIIYYSIPLKIGDSAGSKINKKIAKKIQDIIHIHFGVKRSDLEQSKEILSRYYVVDSRFVANSKTKIDELIISDVASN